jgi:hypothetical protein
MAFVALYLNSTGISVQRFGIVPQFLKNRIHDSLSDSEEAATTFAHWTDSFGTRGTPFAALPIGTCGTPFAWPLLSIHDLR